MTRRLKISLIVLGSLFGCVLLFSFSALAFLRSGAGSRWLLGKVKATLAQKGMQLEFQDGSSVDILRGLHLRGVRFHSPDLDAEIRAVDVDYRFSLLRRHLTVALASVDHPTVKFHPVTAKAEAPPAPAPEANPSAKARKYFQAPPVSLTVEKFRLESLELDVAMPQLRARFPETSLHAALDFGARHLTAAGDFRSNAANHFELTAPHLRLQAAPKASAEWKLALVPESDHGKLTISPSHAEFSLGAISLEQVSENAKTVFKIDDIRASASGQAEGRVGQPLADGPSELTRGGARLEARVGAGRGSQAHGTHVSPLGFDGQDFALEAKITDDIALTADYRLRHLVAAALARPLDAGAQAGGRLAKDLTRFSGLGEARVAGMELAKFGAEGSVDGGLRWHKQIRLNAEPRLALLLKNGASLRRLGGAQIEVGADVMAPGKYTGFLELVKLADADTKLEGNVSVEVRQTQPGTLPLRFTPITSATRFARADGKWTFHTEAENQSLRAKTLNLPAEKLTVEGSYGPEKDRAAVSGHWKIGEEEALAFHGDTTVGDHRVQFQGTVEALVGRYLDTLLGKKMTAAYGRWQAKSEMVVDARLPGEDATGGFAKAGGLKATGETKLSQWVDGGTKPKLVLPQPLSFKHEVTLENGKGRMELTGEVPSLQVTGVGKYDGMQLIVTGTTPDAAAAQDFDFSARARPGRVFLPNAPELAGLDVDVAARVRGQNRFDLSRCQFDFNHGMVTVSAEGGGNVRQQNFLLKGTLQAKVPATFPAVAGHRGSGSAQFPWNLYVRHGTEMDFDGTLTLDKIAWSHGAQRFSGMTGRLPVSEKLVRHGVDIQFAHLITQNPFERVDFDRLRPLIHRADQLKIDEIGFEEKTYGPMFGYFSMNQNMIFARQFDLTVGSRGAAYGEMYFNFHPQSLQLGLLARLTAMDLSEILPRKYLVKQPSGDRKLSGRAGMVVNLHRGSVDGRIDITEIGGGQLVTMINVLDPGFKDEKMNLARTALGVGYPTFVGMVFENGYLDLGIDLHVLAADQRIDVRSIPISSMVTSASAEVVKKTKGVPLK